MPSEARGVVPTVPVLTISPDVRHITKTPVIAGVPKKLDSPEKMGRWEP